MTTVVARATRAARASKRAMPIERLIANGMSYPDAVELPCGGRSIRRLDELRDATGGSEPGASRAGARPEPSDDRSLLLPARGGVLALRSGPAPRLRSSQARRLRRDAERLRTGRDASPAGLSPYRYSVAGRSAVGLADRAGHGRPDADGHVLGGIDAWREEFEVGAGYLTERGLTAFLVDAPGQGETRLFGGCTSTRRRCRRSGPSSTRHSLGQDRRERSGSGATARGLACGACRRTAILASRRAASTAAPIGRPRSSIVTRATSTGCSSSPVAPIPRSPRGDRRLQLVAGDSRTALVPVSRRSRHAGPRLHDRWSAQALRLGASDRRRSRSSRTATTASPIAPTRRMR